MAEQRARDLIQQGDHLFSVRMPLMSLWQEICDNFYPENAEYTRTRTLGEDFAANLDTSYPMLVRRDLGDSLSSMLRPAGQEWFAIELEEGQDDLDQAGRDWLQWATRVQRRAMYDRASQFTRATKQGDHDFASIGQCVISSELNQDKTGLLFRCWPVRDTAWCDNAGGLTDTVHRKWKPSARDLVRRFPQGVSEAVRRRAEKEPYAMIDVRHCVVPSDYYEIPGQRRARTPFVSVYVEAESGQIIEEIPSWSLIYTIPRWRPYACSQYGYSPATTTALADARLIQAITRTLLEAGERATNPPMIGVADAIKSDLELFPGGFTHVDAKYDERLGEVLRPLVMDKSGIPFGMDMAQDIRGMIRSAFYLDKLTMPALGTRQMTAFEVGQIVQENIRQVMPLFEPMEADYNGSLCEETFNLLMRNGAFGSPDNIPESLQGRRTRFQFTSPLTEATERAKATKFAEGMGLVGQAAQFDPGLAIEIDARQALRDSLNGIGVPARWLRETKDVDAILAQRAQAQALQQAGAAIGGAAEVAEQVGKAGIAMNEAAA